MQVVSTPAPKISSSLCLTRWIISQSTGTGLSTRTGYNLPASSLRVWDRAAASVVSKMDLVYSRLESQRSCTLLQRPVDWRDFALSL